MMLTMNLKGLREREWQSTYLRETQGSHSITSHNMKTSDDHDIPYICNDVIPNTDDYDAR